jgi:hypothetical protein
LLGGARPVNDQGKLLSRRIRPAPWKRGDCV